MKVGIYWVRLKGFYVVARFSANFPKIAVRQSVGGCGAAEENSKPCKPFSPTRYVIGKIFRKRLLELNGQFPFSSSNP